MGYSDIMNLLKAFFDGLVRKIIIQRMHNPNE